MRSQQLEERRSKRYDALLAAGVELLGSPDGPAVNVRAVCRTAGLTERYFYESFADRDAFVRAVYAWVGTRAQGALLDAVMQASTAEDTIAAPVRAFVELIIDEPRTGRVLLIAPLAEPALSRRGLDLLPGFVELVHSQLPDTEDRQLIAVGTVGALTALFIGYLDGTLTVTREALVAHCIRLISEASVRG
ncbi:MULTISPECIES: TetR/AcrR family transcriptional regulator [Rhodococcus]|uniref:TetR/AcrR family transcriptional regulator n=1 Tax=Rhodococcus cerastii TaxID=908616 RepID=A0ABU4D1N4_9NOCA|nr:MULTISPECIES: TetR/AcrR family transcriptional regulator [Rhodococcus]MDV6303633.1 TetR/AcrR family transcriptional regulator [Rhodococcus cerastii]MDV7991668.1 TetR/AcrR family transcriptional regulator [Rhodococcus sp. IEGM 1374]